MALLRDEITDEEPDEGTVFRDDAEEEEFAGGGLFLLLLVVLLAPRSPIVDACEVAAKVLWARTRCCDIYF